MDTIVGNLKRRLQELNPEDEKKRCCLEKLIVEQERHEERMDLENSLAPRLFADTYTTTLRRRRADMNSILREHNDLFHTMIEDYDCKVWRMKEMHEENPFDFHHYNAKFRTPLETAIRNRRYDVQAWLLQEGVDHLIGDNVRNKEEDPQYVQTSLGRSCVFKKHKREDQYLYQLVDVEDDKY